MKLSEIAEFLHGELVSESDIEIKALAKIESAKAGELTFLANQKYSRYLNETNASAVIVSKNQQSVDLPHIKVDDPYLAFLKVLKLLYPREVPKFHGIHSSVLIPDSATIGNNVSIGAYVHLGEGVRIGNNSIIYPNCVLLDNVTIGENSVLYPCVSVRENCLIGNNVIIHNGAVIGSDGFGFAPVGDVYEKIPQVGNVVIGDDVEIGANCTIDRATMGETIIKKGCKIDNLVQIAHNVIIEENTVIAAQTGISGSTKVGKHVTMGGQVGIVGHVTIGNNVVLAAKSGISKDIAEGEIWFGYPALPIMKQKKIEACLRHLPELTKKIRQMEKLIIELEEKLNKTNKG
jgi:UDP-3-O-[3-hydroxymyristoyl] glucosamine N-acyltransferase